MVPGEQTKPQNILLAVDGSENALAAVKMLGDLPLPPQSQITALAVLDTPRTLRRSMLMGALNATQELLIKKGLQVCTGLLHGNPAEALAGYASEHQPDLIVMGALGLRASLGILLGGVAQQMVEYSCCPILIVRSPYEGLKRLLLASDGSNQSQRAEEYLCSWCIPRQIDIEVIHVLPPIPTPEQMLHAWPVGTEAFMPVEPQPVEELLAMEEEEEANGKVLIERVVSRLHSAGLPAEGVLRRGDAATEIIAYSQNQGIDLIVSGSRGLSAVRSWLLGSVSRKLVHYADCSVLLVK